MKANIAPRLGLESLSTMTSDVLPSSNPVTRHCNSKQINPAFGTCFTAAPGLAFGQFMEHSARCGDNSKAVADTTRRALFKMVSVTLSQGQATVTESSAFPWSRPHPHIAQDTPHLDLQTLASLDLGPIVDQGLDHDSYTSSDGGSGDESGQHNVLRHSSPTPAVAVLSGTEEQELRQIQKGSVCGPATSGVSPRFCSPGVRSVMQTEQGLLLFSSRLLHTLRLTLSR